MWSRDHSVKFTSLYIKKSRKKSPKKSQGFFSDFFFRFLLHKKNLEKNPEKNIKKSKEKIRFFFGFFLDGRSSCLLLVDRFVHCPVVSWPIFPLKHSYLWQDLVVFHWAWWDQAERVTNKRVRAADPPTVATGDAWHSWTVDRSAIRGQILSLAQATMRTSARAFELSVGSPLTA